MKKSSRLHLLTIGARLLAVAAVLASCSKKEEPAPVAQQAVPTAVPTTVPPAATPTPVPTPPPVWREARWGMKKADVLGAFPKEAQKLPAPVPFAQPQDGSMLKAGASDLTIPSYDADGATFKVLFGFSGDALDRIHLSALKPNAGTCEDLQKALTTRHSEPAQRTQTGSSLKGEEIVWKRPDQTIVLGCAGVATLGFVTVTLDYLPPAAGTSSPAP
jgi:hypothetical protein